MDEVNSTLMTQNNIYINSHNNLQIFGPHKGLLQAQSLNTKTNRSILNLKQSMYSIYIEEKNNN